MDESIELQNRVPSLERWIAALFVLVGGPLTYLGWTQSEELPELLVPVVQLGIPLFLIAMLWYVFVQRKRVRIVLDVSANRAFIEEQIFWWRTTRESEVLGADLEIGKDIDGEPYGKLVLKMPGSELLTACEGTDIDSLQAGLLRVRHWIDSAS